MFNSRKNIGSFLIITSITLLIGGISIVLYEEYNRHYSNKTITSNESEQVKKEEQAKQQEKVEQVEQVEKVEQTEQQEKVEQTDSNDLTESTKLN